MFDDDTNTRIEAALSARHAALLATLRGEAAIAFNGWLAAHQADYPNEAPVTADEIEAVNVADKHSRGPEWYASPTRERLNDLGHGVGEPDAVRALLRFITWATEDARPDQADADQEPA